MGSQGNKATVYRMEDVNMLDEKHGFTEKKVLEYTKQFCEGLDDLHSENEEKSSIIHEDKEDKTVYLDVDIVFSTEEDGDVI